MRDEQFDKPRAKKRFGQHFLNDKNIIRKIVSTASVREGDRVLEIGPGTGVLTEELLATGANVTAIEVDRDLIAYLEEKFHDERLTIIPADALRFSYQALAKSQGGRLKLVANLPYYISGPLLSKLLTERAAFSIMVLMFQKEVAVRITSGPGSRDYGNLSVLSQAFCDVKKEFDVPARLFSPKPKVDSSVVSFKVMDAPKIDFADEDFFRAVVRSAFGARRKTLSNALSSLGLEKDETLAALLEADIDPKRRGETLNLNEFGALTRALYRRKKPLIRP